MSQAPTNPIIRRADLLPVEGFEGSGNGTVTWRTLFSADRTPTAGLTAGIADVPAGGSLALHRHAEPEIYHLLDGEGIVTIDGVERTVSAGDAIFIPGDAEHGIRAGESPLRFFYVFPTDSFADIVYRFSE